MITTSLLAALMGFIALLFAGWLSKRPAPGSPDSERSFAIFLLAVLCWLGWVIAIIALGRIGPDAHPTPAALIVVAAAAGGWAGMSLGTHLQSKGGTDAR